MNQTGYEILIYKQLSDEISQEELSKLNEWLELSLENREEAALITAVWAQTERNTDDIEALADAVDMDQEFSFLTERINTDEITEKEEKEVKVIPIRRRYLAIAAGFAVLVGLASVVLLIRGFGETEMAELVAGENGEEILLADGSSVYLNAHSTLKYPEKFDGDTREVELQGEAFFEITKGSEHPFTVHTPYEDITVLGTSFNVRAFADESKSEVAVATGKVEVASKAAKVVLLPNEKAIVDHADGKISLEETESLNESAWHTKTIQFSNTPLPTVLDNLEKVYDVEFTFENRQELETCLFTSTFQNDDLSTVLETVSTVLDVTISDNGNGEYVLVGGECK